MSKGRRRQRRYNGCRDKARYGTREEAMREQPSQLAYPCVSCACWHLTTAEVQPRRFP